MPITPEISGTSIVIIGAFNPAIFQPSWFAAQGLVPKKEAEDIRDVAIHPELAFFKMSWLQAQVVPNRFIASTAEDSESGTLRDIVAGAFTALRHTPVRQVGINVEQHFKMPSEEAWNDFGHKLAPKELWRNVMADPGLRAMTILDKAPRQDKLPGQIRVDVEASVQVRPFGIYFRVNDHFDCEAMTPKAIGTEHLLKILGAHFSDSLQRSQKLIQTLLSNAWPATST